MKRWKIISTLLLVVVISIPNWHCTLRNKTDWNINLSRDNKNPYGLYLAYHSLKYLFPESKIEYLNPAYNISRLNTRLKNTDKAFVVFIGQSFTMTDEESEDLLRLISSGKNVMISAYNISDNLMQRLQTKQHLPSIYAQDASQCINMKDDAARDYCYKGESVMAYFNPDTDKGDSAKPYYGLGATSENVDDYIVYSIGDGKLFLHAAPLVFSNYFLLQNNNQAYLHKVFSFVSYADNVLWMDFNIREAQHYSDWSVLWRNKATRMFFIMSFIALLLYVLFEMKRKQKIIPVVKPNENTSVAFVETVGRLYYNTGNHTNLSEKMVQHFLEFVRVHYYLSTNILDEEFEKSLSAKSGISSSKVKTLVHQINQVQHGAVVDERFLFELHSNIQELYSQL